jgi:hypothetical protein
MLGSNPGSVVGSGVVPTSSPTSLLRRSPRDHRVQDRPNPGYGDLNLIAGLKGPDPSWGPGGNKVTWLQCHH